MMDEAGTIIRATGIAYATAPIAVVGPTIVTAKLLVEFSWIPRAFLLRLSCWFSPQHSHSQILLGWSKFTVLFDIAFLEIVDG